MPMLNLNIGEEDVVRLILEFLHTRELHITQLSLERETGVINGNYADDVLFLRQLILDGQWEDVLEFIQPLSILQDFQTNKFNFVILKHQFIELLCMKSEIKVPSNVKNIVDDVVQVLNKIEKIAPSRDEYSNLCLLLTLPSITDHAQFKKWNPSDARIKCFQEVYPLVEQFLPMTSNAVVPKSAKNDRLMNLIIKGILYEACVNYCQSKATGTQVAHLNSVDFSDMLEIPGFDESDLSLLSWLQSIPFDIFSIPFEQRSLNVELERLVRPALHTSWTEHMLVTPIKPGKFPHLAMPFRRPRSAADAMTRSLRPLPDGAPRHPAAMALSAIDYGPSTSYFAGFHLTGIRDSTLMNTSVDRLFEGQNEDLNESNPNARSSLQPIEEQTRTPGDNSNSHIGASKVTTREHRPPTDEAPIASAAVAPIPPPQGDVMPVAPSEDGEITRERLNEYRMQMKRECDDYLRNLCSSEMRTDNSMDQSVNLNDAFIESQSESQTEAQLEADMNITEPSADSPPTLHDEPSSSNAENDAVVAGSSGVMRVISGNRSRATSTPSHLPVPPIVAILPDEDTDRPTFKPVTALEDLQAIRCAEFHPNGMLYAVGSNTKNLRICKYPKMDEVKPDKLSLPAPTVLLKRTKHHKGSIYCLAWSPAGNLLATGSNDKTVKLMRFNSETCNLEGQEVELSMHDGTVRDVCFIEDTINKASLLVSGGAGDCNIYVTDCATGRLFQTMTGHTGHVLSLYTWGGAMFVSSSQDKTARFWDLRIGGCVNTITSTATLGAVVGAGVTATGSVMTSLALDPSGRLLVCGNENGCCELYDVRGSRALQRFFPHTSDVRSVRFSPGAYYLLTASYDGQIMLTDMQGDLTCVLPSVLVARHHDKVISARWHPEDFSFLSTSADRTAVLWTIPQ